MILTGDHRCHCGQRNRALPRLLGTLWMVVVAGGGTSVEGVSGGGGVDDARWALRPLVRPAAPDVRGVGAGPAEDTTAIDAFVLAKLNASAPGGGPSPPASKRAMIRRATFDLHGLPPTPQEVDAFLADEGGDAFSKVVDRLLRSPRYGERWARHWMDIVHFAETHGHDEDAVRPNAWPYRDYLIRSFNEDKPYRRFVREQIAGDVIFPRDPEATVATGFLAAGPWDSSSQMGIQDGTTDKKIAQHLDRDDMLTTVMATFVSLTVQCARCHDHKFDPVSLEDYYALQAVFAGVDRVDRPVDANPGTARKREELAGILQQLRGGTFPVARLMEAGVQDEVVAWEAEIRRRAPVWRALKVETCRSDHGSSHDVREDGSVLFSGERPDKDVYVIRGRTSLGRISALQLEVLADAELPSGGPGRQDNGNFHLSEISVRVVAVEEDGDAAPAAVELVTPVADFDQAGWTVQHAVDGDPSTAWGIYPEVGKNHSAVFRFAEPVTSPDGVTLVVRLEQAHGGGHLIGRPRLSVTGLDAVPPGGGGAPLPDEVAAVLATPAGERTRSDAQRLALHVLTEKTRRAIAGLPGRTSVFAVASDFSAMGNFKPPAGVRRVDVLDRGDINRPLKEAQPGTLSCLPGLPARFDLADGAGEGMRRAALADWVAADENVLTWRSVANRVWQYHFGRGIVATPNDFGAMGARPTHPGLLDWLACALRDNGGSLKGVHRAIMTSATYRQASHERPGMMAVDPGNVLLWRADLRRLDADAVRDGVLALSGKLDLTMGGPSQQHFTSSKGVHITPTLDYLGFDPDDPANFRRSVYRFLFRTVPDPFMQVLDCPDASQLTPTRPESVTAHQALAMMHSRFVVRQSEHMAERLRRERPGGLAPQVALLAELAFSRALEPWEAEALGGYARDHGLANVCKVVFNSNEFFFIE